MQCAHARASQTGGGGSGMQATCMWSHARLPAAIPACARLLSWAMIFSRTSLSLSQAMAAHFHSPLGCIPWQAAHHQYQVVECTLD